MESKPFSFLTVIEMVTNLVNLLLCCLALLLPHLSCACRRHVGDMSPTADNVGKILLTGPVGDIDIFFLLLFPCKKMSGNADIS
jgi:hypothetical protein